MIEEWDGGAAPAKSYTLGHDIIAQSDSTNGVLYLLKDGHGSTRLLVDDAATPTVIESYLYDAYGNMILSQSTLVGTDPLTTILYSGQQTDAATGLQYLRARYYDPKTGTFNRLDPFAGNNNDPQSLHKYLYANASPVMYADPTGMFSLIGMLVNVAITSILSYIISPIIQPAASYVANAILPPDMAARFETASLDAAMIGGGGGGQLSYKGLVAGGGTTGVEVISSWDTTALYWYWGLTASFGATKSGFGGGFKGDKRGQG